MKETLYRSIEKVVRSVSALKRNAVPLRDNPHAIKNFLLAFGTACLDEKTRSSCLAFARETVDAAFFTTVFPDDIKTDYPFPVNMHIPAADIRLLAKLSGAFQELLPAGVFEYFVEEEQEHPDQHRKKTGSYYTPPWIVNDIIAHTLEPVLLKYITSFEQARDTGDVRKFTRLWFYLEEFRILDPAGGWGVFLVEAYRSLRRFYRKIGELGQELLTRSEKTDLMLLENYHYNKEDLEDDIESLKEAIALCKKPERQILTKNLYAFDINKDAINLASHILKVIAHADNNDNQSIALNLKVIDFIDWMERSNQSFDVILGNPPYFNIGGGGRGKKKTRFHSLLKEHPAFSQYFRSQSDIFYYFIIGSMKVLKINGVLSFIVPAYWIDNEYADLLRAAMLQELYMEEIVNFTPLPVFETFTGKRVGVDTLIFRGSKKSDRYQRPTGAFPVFMTEKKYLEKHTMTASDYLQAARTQGSGVTRIKLSPLILSSGKWTFSAKPAGLSFFIKDGVETLPLGDISPLQRAQYPKEFTENEGKESIGICDIGQGQETGYSPAFVVAKEFAALKQLEEPLLKPLIKSRHVRRWFVETSQQLIIMTKDDDDLDEFPNVKAHLEFYREMLERRQRVITGQRKWYSLSIPQNVEIFASVPKIVVPYRASTTSFALDTTGYFNDSGDVRGLIIKPELQKKVTYEYLLALLNSRLVYMWYEKMGKKKGDVFEFFSRPLSRIPVRVPALKVQKEIGKLVQKISEKVAAYGTGENAPNVSDMEREIDEMIFDIYKTSEEDLREKVLG